MSDLIDRQKALDAVSCIGDENSITTIGHFMRILRALPSTQSERWIPVTERLPKRNEDVLVTKFYDGREDFQKSCRYVEVASCHGEDEDVSWCSYSDEYKVSPRRHHVIAWMPLPKPWKEGEAD